MSPPGNHKTGAQRTLKAVQRRAWLLAHPALLTRLPGRTQNVEGDHDAALDEAVRGMKLERLYAPTASATNARWWIRGLVDDLRKPEGAEQA